MAEQKKETNEGGEAAATNKLPMQELYFEKLGTTQYFDENGVRVGATVLKKLPSVILSSGTNSNKVRVAYFPVDKSKLTKVEVGQFKGLKTGYRFVAELNPAEKVEAKKGLEVDIELSGNDRITVYGKSIGKGFQGVMKRFNFGGIPASHGAGPVHRSPGGIGMCTSPGRLFKGRKFPGRMGGKNVISQNIKVAKTEGDLVFVTGSVPGSKGSLVKVVKV